jgi:hypothetical protein
MKASQILQHDNQISSDEEVEMNSWSHSQFFFCWDPHAESHGICHCLYLVG